MANMSYCRFENTCSDLQDCFDALMEAGGVKEAEDSVNDYEKPYIQRLVKLCRKIVDQFEYCNDSGED